jgi:hypothetical protein
MKDYPARDAFDKSGLEELLKEKLEVSSSALKEYISRYEVIAQLVPMDGERSKILLSTLIEQEKIDDYLITEDSETLIQQLTDTLYEQAEILFNGKSIVASVEIIFTILVIIEHEMQYVYDEGFTFQCIMDDGFKLLNKIAAENYDQNTATALTSVAKEYNKLRSEDMRNYDDEWADISDAFLKRTNAQSNTFI